MTKITLDLGQFQPTALAQLCAAITEAAVHAYDNSASADYDALALAARQAEAVLVTLVGDETHDMLCEVGADPGVLYEEWPSGYAEVA